MRGAAILAAGRRRETIADIERFLRSAFETASSPSQRRGAYADIAAMRRSAGRPTQPADCQIAAVARSRSMTVATRNVRDFEGMGIDVVDPWTAG